jgi:hypothetical protein
LGKNRFFPPVITVLMEVCFHASGTKNKHPRGIDARLFSCPGERKKNYGRAFLLYYPVPCNNPDNLLRHPKSATRVSTSPAG